jgi:deoxyribonuclease-4
VENAAGQGCAVGARLEELAQVLGRAGDHPRLGVCIDTCHAFAAGYDLRGAGDWHAFREAVARTVGLERVHAVHVNDSLHPLGSRRDRHAAIGEGHIGRRGFRHLLADPALGRRPLILETPKEGPDGEDMDRRNLATLRRLARRARAGVTGR